MIRQTTRTTDRAGEQLTPRPWTEPGQGFPRRRGPVPEPPAHTLKAHPRVRRVSKGKWRL